MKLPTQIKTRHKIRDLAIIKDYAEGNTQEDIAANYGLTRSRIGQILYDNLHLLELNKNYEKMKRVQRLNRAMKKEEEIGLPLNEKRDFLDISKELRAEIEGDKQQSINPIQINFVEVKNLINQPVEVLIEQYRNLQIP